AGGFLFRAVHALNRLKPIIKKEPERLFSWYQSQLRCFHNEMDNSSAIDLAVQFFFAYKPD
ncbi:hypothetical protein, partial [Paenibacillus alvei]|uniref:hypothetical protein n=1 Tax=Paenibacillus alvei TaxID=44250 RepID=UPI002284FBF0